MTGQSNASPEEIEAVRAASMQFYDALRAMFVGDPEPLSDLYLHTDDVTYLPAEGGLLVGWDAVYADWVKQAEKSLGATFEVSDMQVTAGTDMGTSCNRINGKITLPDGTVQQTAARESNVFRKEDGKWKMIAHHCDALTGWVTVVEQDG